MTNSELREKLNQYISNKKFDLDQISSLFGSDSEEYGFAEKFNTRNSKPLGERLAETAAQFNQESGDDVSIESAIQTNQPVANTTITVESPVGFEDMYTSYEVEIEPAIKDETSKTIIIDGNGGTQSLNDNNRSNAYHTGSQIEIWKESDGTFSWCVTGVDKNGNYYETDDYSDFNSIQEAEEAALDTLQYL